MVRPPASRQARWATVSMPAGHAADYRHAGLGQAAGHHPRSLLAIDRGPARADNGHSPFVPLLDPAPHIENGRRIEYLAEIGRIVGIIPGKDVDPGLCQPGHLGIQVQFVPHLEQVAQGAPVEACLSQVVGWCLPGSLQVAKIVKQGPQPSCTNARYFVEANPIANILFRHEPVSPVVLSMAGTCSGCQGS